MGLSVAEVRDLAYWGRGGTFILVARNSVFGGEGDWMPPPAGAMPDLIGESIQVARPADQVAYPLPGGLNPLQPIYELLAFSADGKCVAWSAAPRGADNGSELKTLEVRSQETFRVAVDDASLIGRMAWME